MSRAIELDPGGYPTMDQVGLEYLERADIRYYEPGSHLFSPYHGKEQHSAPLFEGTNLYASSFL